MKKTIDENIAIKISPTKNIEAFQEKSALETSMSLIAEGKLNIPGVDDHVSFLQKLQTEIHTPAKNIELENQLKRIEAIQHEVEFSVKKTEIEKKQLAAQKDAFLKRINNFKEENDKTKAELEEQKLELEAKRKMLLQAQDEIAVKQQALETKEKLILENSDIDAKLESLAALKEDLRLESLKKLEEMREFKETKDQIKSELDDRVAIVEARERELKEKEMLLSHEVVEEGIQTDILEHFNKEQVMAFNNAKIIFTNLEKAINSPPYGQDLIEKFNKMGYNENNIQQSNGNSKTITTQDIKQALSLIKSNLHYFVDIRTLQYEVEHAKKELNNKKNQISEESYEVYIHHKKIKNEVKNLQETKLVIKQELEKYNAEIDTKVLELVAIKQVQDGDVILDRYEQIKNTKDYIDNFNKELGLKYNMIVSREKNLTNLKAQIYKNPEYIQKSDATTQAFDPELEARAKNITTKFYENVIAEKNITSAIKYREKELGELIKERALYEYHGEVVDEATQYESTDNEIMDMLKTLAQINENSENPLSKEAFYNRIGDMESKLIMSQLSAEYLDKAIVKKSHKLATLDQAFQARKYLDEHKAVENLRVEVVKDLMTKKIAPKFDAFLLREQNIGLDMQKSLFDVADQHIAAHHDQSDNQMNLLGQELHQFSN